MKQLLKALDAGFTAFCNELWLPTFGFHLFDDPADALEEGYEPGCDGKCARYECVCPDVPVELAGSLSAPGDGPEVGDFPRSASTSGQPLTAAELLDAAYVCRQYFPGSRSWERLAERLELAAYAMK